jgi:multicomponent Na+:H+ antiporter subunit C
MIGWLGIVVGVLAAAGTKLLLQSSPARRAMGIVLLGLALNVVVFAMTGAEHGRAPLVELGATEPSSPFADPVPQALVLTAIVIGFALQAFALVLITRTGRLDDRPDDEGLEKPAASSTEPGSDT